MAGRAGQRIVLCSPPWSYAALGATAPRPGGRDVTGQGHLPELGLHFLATTLDQRGHGTAVEEGYGRDLASQLRAISAWHPSIVGVGVQTALWPAARRLVAALRAALPIGTRVVVGGPHATLHQQRLLDELPELDAVFVGPAEGSLPGWIEEGMAGGRVVPSRGEGQSHDQDWVHRHVQRVDWRAYQPNMMFLGARPFATSLTSVGCARACASCSMTRTGGGRLRDVAELLLEQRALVDKQGIRSLGYMDDMPIFAREGVGADGLLEDLAAEGPFLSWSMYLDSFDLDAERFLRLREAGCRRLLMLVESGDSDVRTYAKGRVVTQAAVVRSAELAHAAGIEVGARFQIGYPGESSRQAEASIELALALPLTLASFVRAMAYPGSAMARDYRLRGLATDDESRWSYYGRPVTPDAMTTAEQEAVIRAGVRRFYGRPAAAVRLLVSPPPSRRVSRALALARRFVLDGVS